LPFPFKIEKNSYEQLDLFGPETASHENPSDDIEKD
jgi:hypothetical protein